MEHGRMHFSPPLNEYNGFESVQDPNQYLNAPATIMRNDTGLYNFDISQDYHEISPMVNAQDPVQLNFLVQSAIADTRGFKILSWQELDDLKKESLNLHSRKTDLSNKLSMEYKLRDAASSISKLHVESEAAGNGNRRSFGMFNNKKRMSKNAEEEVDQANRKIQTLESESLKVMERIYQVDCSIMNHNSGVLALTHQSSASSTARIYSKHLQRASVDQSNSSSAVSSASDRMMRRSWKKDSLDTVISSVLSFLGEQENNKQVDDRVSYLGELVNDLMKRCDETGSSRDHMRATILEAINQYEPAATHAPCDDELRGKLLELVMTGNNNKEVNANMSDSKVKTLLQQQIDGLTQSYDQNCAELERLELENVDLKTSLREVKFQSQAQVQQLENELRSNKERVGEWKERCEVLKSELESVVRSLEDLTRQTVEYESERQKLEKRVAELQTQMHDQSRSDLDKRASKVMGLEQLIPPNMTDNNNNNDNNDKPLEQPTSVAILRHEFKRILMDLNTKHTQSIKKEQAERKKLESLLRSIKTSSYAAHIPPGKLESMGVV